jgi:hypothetical protein
VLIVKAWQLCYPYKFHSLVNGASVCPIRANQSPILFINQGCRLLPISLWNYTILNNMICNDKKKAKKTNFYPTEENISKMQSLRKIAASSNSKSIGIHGVSMSSNENRKFDFFLHESTFPCLLAMLGNILHVWLAHLTLQLNWESQHLKTRERFETMKQVVQCNCITFTPTSSTLLTFGSIRHKGEQAGLNEAHVS